MHALTSGSMCSLLLIASLETYQNRNVNRDRDLTPEKGRTQDFLKGGGRIFSMYSGQNGAKN